MSKKTIYYHATLFENISSIMKEGLKPGIYGNVQLTTDKDRAIEYVAMYQPRPVDIAVIKVNVADDEVEPYWDGSMSEGGHHFAHAGHIAADRLELEGGYTVGGPQPSER